MSANRLGAEKSPYLLQHKDNPVQWYAWGEDAFAAARAQSKPIFLSIGYSTCYWCHVMEKDSFEHDDTAAALKRDFISIKVDREEHPDIDALYMDAVVGMTGQGGWPMTVFLTPNLEPFFGGTFFRHDEFLKLLSNIQSVWQQTPEKVLQSGQQVTQLLRQHDATPYNEPLSAQIFDRAVRGFSASFDANNGGFGGAPKFPPAQGLIFLLHHYEKTKNADALRMATTTLDCMARGGIHDQLGGGFHRYSVDEFWLIPHFEKMLYDNALIALSYLEAYRITGTAHYADVARATLNYVLRDMPSPEGGFYAAQDAGEVDHEGDYYVWKFEELRQHLSDAELQAVHATYGATPQGNFEHGQNTLYIPRAVAWSQTQAPALLQARATLSALRAQRPAPGLDHKILTGWNGLMIAALAQGSVILKEERYVQAAVKAAEFLRQNMQRNGQLLRRYCNGDARFTATCTDYAFLIRGLIALYHADKNENWIRWALDLQTQQDNLFGDSQAAGYFTSAADTPGLLVRQKEWNDGALPSANSTSAHNLLQLHHLTGNLEFYDRAQAVLATLSNKMAHYSLGLGTALDALIIYLETKPMCTGPDCVPPPLQHLNLT